MNAIEINNVSKRYKKFQLRHISFYVERGTVTGFIGQNGTGKTTLIKCILNLLKKSEGEILLFDQDHIKNEVELKAQIGVVFDELHVPSHSTPMQLEKMYAQVYKTWDSQYFSNLLFQLNVPKYDKVNVMSRGTKMKLALALALAYHPKLLILDEPTSGLDPIIRDEVLDILQDYMENDGNSILFSSHITSDLEKIADTITCIHDGEILFSKSKDDLLYGYGIWRGTEQQALDVPIEAIVGERKFSFGKEYLVERAKVHTVFELEKPTLEDIMLFMIKGRE